MRKYALRIVLAALLLCIPLGATDYYVDNTGGANGNDGLGTGTAWETITYASSQISAGDTVYILEGTYEETINPPGDGSSGNRIVYQNYDGQTVVITNVSTAIRFGGDDYITVDGIEVRGTSVEADDVHQFVSGDGSDYAILQNCTFEYAGGWHGAVWSNSDYVQVLDNTMAYCGVSQPPGDDDLGDLLAFDECNNCLIEGNALSFSGHDTFRMENGSNNIIKGNVMNNANWGRVSAFYHHSPIGDPSNNFFESNIIINASLHQNENGDQPNRGTQCSFSYTVFRWNEYYNNIGAGISIYTTEAGEGSYNRVVHNVFYSNGHNGLGTDMPGVRIWDQIYGADPNEMQDNVMMNNIFRSNGVDGVQFQDGDSAKHTDADNWDDGDGDPNFVNEIGADFTLNVGSSCIDNAGWLTTITTANGSGTSFAVGDASFFRDGMGVTTGDEIQLEGDSASVTVTEVNYATDTITVDESVTWTQGDGVAYPFKDGTPDQGAYEYDAGSPPVPGQGPVLKGGSKVVLKSGTKKIIKEPYADFDRYFRDKYIRPFSEERQ